MTIANYQALGTSAAATTTAVTPTIPTHAINDLMVLMAEGSNTDFGTDPSGWTAIAQVDGATSSLKVWFRIATSTDENTDHPTTITPTTANHTYAQVATARNVNLANPYTIIARFENTGMAASTAAALPGGVTVVDDVLYWAMGGYSGDGAGPLFSLESNADVTTLTERNDEGTALGNGGGVVLYTGTIAAAGNVRSTTFTSSLTTGMVGLVLAVNPIADFTISGTVTINGSAAANGNDVRVLDQTQPASSFLCIAGTTGGGTGAFTCKSPYTDHNYQAVYEDGASYGASATDVAV